MKLAFAVLLVCLVVPLQADVHSLTFQCISAPGQCGSAASGLSVDVVGNVASYNDGFAAPIAIGVNQALFVIKNTGPSSVHEVYFDDGTILGIASLFETAGVNYKLGASPSNLPDKNNASPPFDATAAFSTEIDGSNSDGVSGASERLGILFNLQGGQTYANVLTALGLGGAAGGLRVGLHVGNTNGNQSAAFVNGPFTPPGPPTPPQAIPEPTSVLLFGTLATAALGLLRKRVA